MQVRLLETFIGVIIKKQFCFSQVSKSSTSCNAAVLIYVGIILVLEACTDKWCFLMAIIMIHK